MTQDAGERFARDPAMSAFVAGMERWAALMQAFARTPPGSPEFQKTLLSLQEGLAAQLDAWLRTSHPFTGLQFGPPVTPAGSADPARAFGPDAARIACLLGQWVQLQGQFAAHWDTIGRAAAGKFGAQLARPASGAPDLRKLYDLWIDCAEEAYAQTAHSDAFARSVAELVNTALSLQIEGRKYLQQWARAVGVPTREEIDALTDRINELESRARGTARATPSRKRQPRVKGKR